MPENLLCRGHKKHGCTLFNFAYMTEVSRCYFGTMKEKVAVEDLKISEITSFGPGRPANSYCMETNQPFLFLEPKCRTLNLNFKMQ